MKRVARHCRRVVIGIGTLATGMPALAAAPDMGLGGAIAMLLVAGALMICVATGFIGYRLGYQTRHKRQYALAGALSPIAAIFVYFWYLDLKDEQAREAVRETNEAVMRVAQTRIDAMCANLLARETRAVDLQRSLHLRVIPHWPGLNVPASAMDWPVPLDRVTLAFDAVFRDYLRKLRFEQPYFERHHVTDRSKELDYVEHADSRGLYALRRARYWRTLLPRLDEESRQELSRNIRPEDPAERFIGHRPRKPLARYGLEISDVSTREDRVHWTARLRVQVIEMASGDGLFEIERTLPILIDSGGGITDGVRLCARPGNDAVAKDRNFDWLGYLAREVSAEARR